MRWLYRFFMVRGIVRCHPTAHPPDATFVQAFSKNHLYFAKSTTDLQVRLDPRNAKVEKACGITQHRTIKRRTWIRSFQSREPQFGVCVPPFAVIYPRDRLIAFQVFGSFR
jgi:hypothetical protein